MLNIVRIITLYSNDFSIVRIVFLFKELHSLNDFPINRTRILVQTAY